MSNFDAVFSGLNPQQRLAVETIDGPVLVIAGPGTGKTQVLAARISNILRSTDVNPSNILCLTFTEAGVIAMRQRLQHIVGAVAYQVKIHTFHSFANEIIQAFPAKFAFAKELSQLDDLQKIKLIRQVLDQMAENTSGDISLLPFHDRYMHESHILSAIQTLKREGWTAEDFRKLASEELEQVNAAEEINPKTGKPKTAWAQSQKIAQKNVELSEIYSAYQKLMRSLGKYDYDDMIIFLLEKLNSDEELLAHYQEKFLYILVDEYQDTNGAQNKILKTLGNFDSRPNIFAVGDDDQAIYRFQGANVENILFFNSQFEEVKIVTLDQNYRSTQTILDAAGSMIRNNKLRLVGNVPGLTKDLKANAAGGIQVALGEFPTQESENRFVVQEVQKLIAAGAPPNDIAVLYRRHHDGEDIAEALLRAEVPIRLAAGRDALSEKIVRQFIELLRVIDYSELEMDPLLSRILFYDWLGLEAVEVFEMLRAYNVKEQSLWQQMREEGSVSMRTFAEKIVAWKRTAHSETLSNALREIAEESGLLKKLFANEEGNWEDINSFTSFMNYVRDLNRAQQDLTLAELLRDIDLLQEARMSIAEAEIDTDKQGVNLLTVHRAKGLEFKYVFVVKLYDGNWGGYTKREIIKLPPKIFDLDGEVITSEIDLELEDERRLLYVAMTRAKAQLYLSYANEYTSTAGTLKKTAASAFIGEISQNTYEKLDSSPFLQPDAEYSFKQLAPLPEISDAESVYLKALVSDFRLSASSLQEFAECALKFKFNRLLRLPQTTEKALALGTAVHFALEQLNRSRAAKTAIDSEGIIAAFKKRLNAELLSQADLKLTQQEGEKVLREYLQNYSQEELDVAAVEYYFGGRGVALELPEQDPVILTGKIDAVAWLDRELGKVKLIDYKTSSPKSANEIKGLTQSSDGGMYQQLVFYKLVTDLDPDFRPALGKPKYHLVEVELDFLKPNSSGNYKREAFTVEDSDVEELKVVIDEAMRKIRTLDFSNRCGVCEYCRWFN